MDLTRIKTEYMLEYKRISVFEKYHAVQVFECPIDIMMLAASLAGKNVTIENYMHPNTLSKLSVSINNGNLKIEPDIKQAVVDFQISKTDFFDLKDIWDAQGCYAVFHDSEKIKFKVTDLNGLSRYKALDNFKWTIELAIPGGSSDGWGQITSPDNDLIDKIERYIETLDKS